MDYGGFAVAQLVEALRYKPESRGFHSRWCQWNFSLLSTEMTTRENFLVG